MTTPSEYSSQNVVFWHPRVLFESDYGARGLPSMALWPRVGRVLTKMPFGSNPKEKRTPFETSV